MKVSKGVGNGRSAKVTALQSPKLIDSLNGLSLITDTVEYVTRLNEVINDLQDNSRKPDLHIFIYHLDRMDDILSKLIEHYHLNESIQVESFTQVDLDIITKCLSSMRLLLESCSSRNLFNSYDRLNHLLKTTDIGVLEGTLELLVVPGRKLESHKSLRTSFKDNISLSVISALTGYVKPLESDHIALKIYLLQLKRVEDRDEQLIDQLLYTRYMAVFLSIMMSPVSSLGAEIPLFSVNPFLVTEIAQNVNQSGSFKIASISMLALRSFLKYDGKMIEINSALRLSSPHGALMNILRSLSSCIVSDSPFPVPGAFFTAYVDLFIHLAASHELHSSLLSSGALNELIRIVEHTSVIHFKATEKLVIILENLINKSTITLEPFLNMDGLHIIVKKIHQLVNSCASSESCAEHDNFLSALLRIIERLLVTFANEDRMRNLIETALFDSLKYILERSAAFTAEIVSHSIAIIAAFVHNEPNTLGILQERQVTQTLVDSICNFVHPDGDVISGVMLALGATCLNSEGEAYFQKKNPLKKFLSIFLDEAYSRALLQHGNASIIGQSMDEFMRHHPNLRKLCVDEISILLKAAPSYLKTFDQFKLVKCDLDKGEAAKLAAEPAFPKTDPPAAIILECLCVFLEPIILNDQHYELLSEKGMMIMLLQCIWSPGLGPDHPSSTCFHSLIHLFQRFVEKNFDHVLLNILTSIDCEKRLPATNHIFQNKKWSKLYVDVTEQEISYIDYSIGLVNILSVLYESCSMIVTNSMLKPTENVLDTVKDRLLCMLQFIACSHGIFVNLESNTPNHYFATAMTSPLPFAKASVIATEKFSEYADPDDQRIANLRLVVSSIRNVTLSGSLIFTLLFKLFPTSDVIVKCCTVEILNFVSNIQDQSMVIHAQLLTFAMTIWSSIINEHASLQGYLLVEGIDAIARSGGLELFITQLDKMKQMDMTDRSKSSLSNLYILCLMMCARITSLKSYRSSLLEDRPQCEGVSKLISFAMKLCASFIHEVVINNQDILDETGYRLLITVLGNLLSDSDPSDKIRSLSSSVTTSELMTAHDFEQAVFPAINSLGAIAISKHPKVALDFGQYLAKCNRSFHSFDHSGIKDHLKMELYTVIISNIDDLGKFDLSSILDIIKSSLNSDSSKSKSLACLSLQRIISVNPHDDAFKDFTSIVISSLKSSPDPAFLLSALGYLVAYVYYSGSSLEIEQLMIVATCNQSYFESLDSCMNSIPNLISLLFRLSLENADHLQSPLIQCELLERFSAWSFPQKSNMLERFGSILARSPEQSSQLFSDLFQFEGPGLIPRNPDHLKSQIQQCRTAVVEHVPSQWSIDLVAMFVKLTINTPDKRLIVILSVFSELFSSYEFLRRVVLKDKNFDALLTALMAHVIGDDESVSSWVTHLYSVFLLPATALPKMFEKADLVALYCRPIVDGYMATLHSMTSNRKNLTMISESLMSLLNLSSADISSAKMVTYTIASLLFEQKIVIVLSNCLKSLGTDSESALPIIELLENLSRICGRFITKTKTVTSGDEEKLSVADLEEAFGSSDMITDLDVERDAIEEDVDMDILEEEGVLEDRGMNDNDQNMLDEMEGYDEIIDTSEGEISEEEYEDSDGSLTDDSSEDGYEITFDNSEINSDMTEDEFVFEIDPTDLSRDPMVMEMRAHRETEEPSEVGHDDQSDAFDAEFVGSDFNEYSSDFDDDEDDEDDGFIDLQIDIPVSRRRSSTNTWTSLPRMSHSFASGAGRSMPQFSIPSHPLITPGPFMISGNAFDDRMRPIIEPRSEQQNSRQRPSEEKAFSAMFDRPFYVSTLHRWEQLASLLHGKKLESLCVKIRDKIAAILEPVEKSRQQEIADASKSSEDVVIDSEQDASDDDSSDDLSMGGTSSDDQQDVVRYEDTGMDPSFLAAVPFDMLEEVLEQYFAERRANIPPNARVSINQAYLDSLPADIRSLYVSMSEEEVSMFRHLSAGLPNILSAFMEQHGMEESNDELITSESSSPRKQPPEAAAKPEYPSVKESALLLVDHPAIGTIIKSYLSPSLTDKKIFFRLLNNLSQQPKVCTEILGLLVYLLEESPTEQSHLDAALENYLSRKRGPPGTPKAPPLFVHGAKKASNPPSRPSSAGPSLATMSDPFRTGPSSMYYVLRLLQLLNHLALSSSNVKDYFLKQSDKSWTIKRHGKNSSFRTETKFPIALLVAAFESPLIMGNAMLTEQLLRLIHTLFKARQHAQTIEVPGQLFHSFAKSISLSDLSSRAVAYSIHIGQSISHIVSIQTGLVSELCELISKLSDISRKHLDELKKSGSYESVADPLSPQSKCLRVLKVLASVVYSRPGIGDATELTADTPNESLQQDSIKIIKEQFNRVCLNFSGLENYLPLLTDGTENEADGSNGTEELRVASALLPSIECFFVCCRMLTVIIGEGQLDQISRFTEKHRKVLNSLIRATPSLLTVGSLRILTRTPKHLDFDNKRIFFRHQLHRRAMTSEAAQVGSLQLNIRRPTIFEDSYRMIMGRPAEEVRYGKINVKFHGEDGVDAGGVTREWLSELSREIFNPNYALFRTTAADRITYMPNRSSNINPDHLQYFKFVGRLIGKAIYDNRLLDCYFTRSFYKHMLGIPVDFKDLEAIDPDYYKSLNWILENNITDIFEQYFAVDTDEFGIAKTIDLKPHGRNFLVTEDNKMEYVQLIVEYRLYLAIKQQIDSFLSGLYEIIPVAVLKIFNEQELELLISGLPDLDIDDWKANTELTGYIPSSPQIQWFWRCVRAMNVQERTQLIQFVTGTSKIPLEGFSKLQGQSGVQKFQIHRDYGAKDRLPCAHTCFNQLDLPEYDSYEQLRDALMKAVKECSTGFGLA